MRMSRVVLRRSDADDDNDNKDNDDDLCIFYPQGQPLDKLHAVICSTVDDRCSNNSNNTTTLTVSSSSINCSDKQHDRYRDDEEAVINMKLPESINDLNPELLFDSGLVHLACNETVNASQILVQESALMAPASQTSLVLIPLSASSSPASSSLALVDVLKQHVSRTGETVFREDLVAIFVYIIRNLRFSKNASLIFVIDARQLSTDDQKAALDIVLGSVYSAFLAFPDNFVDVKLLVGDVSDWLNDLIQGFRKRNSRFGAKLTTVSPPHVSEVLFDTDNQARCRKHFSHWLDFRQLIEQLSLLTNQVSTQLDTLVSSLSRELPAPMTVDIVDRQIEEHQKALKDVFKSDEFVEFQETAESDLQQLNEIANNLSNQLPDCVYFYRSLQNRHKAIQEQLSKVVCMSKMRLTSRLEMKQVLRLILDISTEISWLNTEACTILDKLDAPILSSKVVDKVANDLADFGNVLVEHLSCVAHILLRVRETVAFNSQADKKLSPLADLLRVASESTRERMARIEERAAANAELIVKIDTISDWCLETFNFLSTLDLPTDASSPSFSPANHPLHLLVQSASRVAQFKLDRPDLVKNSEDFFSRLTTLASELGYDELIKRLHETKLKHEEALNLFHAKEERLDAALKQLLKLPSVSAPESAETSPSAVPRTTMAQMRLQRRILRSVSLLEQGGDGQVPTEFISSSESASVHDSSEDDAKLGDTCSSENNARPRSLSYGAPSSGNRRSVAVLKALDEINEHLLDFERSTCETCSPQTGHSSVLSSVAGGTMMSIADDLPCSPGSVPMRRPSCKHDGNAILTPLGTDPVVMRRRPSAAYSSSSSSVSCSTCRQNHRQSSITSASPSQCSGRNANKRFSCEVRQPATLPAMAQQIPSTPFQQHQIMQLSGSHIGQHQCLLPMSAKDEQIVGELLQTECDYIASLKYVIDNYLIPLTQDCRPHPLQGKLNIVFGNVESLLDFHETLLLPELELCRHNLFMLATCFLRAEQELSSLYVYYNTNKSRSDRLLSENAALFSSIQGRLGHKLDVASYLLKPVQRLAKYSQFLRQLLVGRSPNDVAHGQLMLAERMLSYILRHGNDLLLLEQLRGYDFALAEQGQLLRQDKMMVERKGRSRKLRHLFLFEEILVISKIHRINGRGDFYEYKESVKICDMGLTPVIGRSGTKFEVWFRRPNSGFRYIIKADTPAMRLAWTTDVEELLWRQAVAVKERRAAQFVSMGIGLRGLISLQPSSNNISSRTVNFASPNPLGDDTNKKETTYRRPASVMVLTSDTDTNANNDAPNAPANRPLAHYQNKRPYSWLSSASSSGTQSSSTNNTPAPNANNGVSNNVYSASDSLTSPLLSTTENHTERLLIPNLSSIGSSSKEAFDLQGRLFKSYRRAGELLSISNVNTEDDKSSDSNDIVAVDDVQRLVFTKCDEMEESNSEFEIVHCAPCSVK